MKFRADQVEYWSQNQVETVFFGQQDKELALIISSVPNTTEDLYRMEKPVKCLL